MARAAERLLRHGATKCEDTCQSAARVLQPCTRAQWTYTLMLTMSTCAKHKGLLVKRVTQEQARRGKQYLPRLRTHVCVEAHVATTACAEPLHEITIAM